MEVILETAVKSNPILEIQLNSIFYYKNDLRLDGLRIEELIQYEVYNIHNTTFTRVIFDGHPDSVKAAELNMAYNAFVMIVLTVSYQQALRISVNVTVF